MSGYRFKCCGKVFSSYYVCTQCHEIIHKSCVTGGKYKQKFDVIKGHKISCCGTVNQDMEQSLIMMEEKNSALEETISELVTDNQHKSKHMERFKKEHEYFLNEASIREEEFNKIIAENEETIKKLLKDITVLKSEITKFAHKEYSTISTQTTIEVRNKSTMIETHIEPVELRAVKSQYLIEDMPILVNIPSEAVMSNDNKSNRLTDKQVSHDTPVGDRKSEILILGDDHARNLQNSLNKNVGSITENYKITSILKPGAPMKNLIENMDILAKNFTFRDYIILIGGSNDLLSYKFPSFKLLLTKLKACAHTNIIILSVPFSKNNFVNYNIMNYNYKLNEFVHKFGRFSEGKVTFIDFSSKKCVRYSMAKISKQIFSAISDKCKYSRNLIFVQTDNQFTIEKTTKRNVLTDSSDNSVLTVSDAAIDRSASPDAGTSDSFSSFLGTEISLVH